MDGFTYHDIFQTKGVEYLVIIAFLLLLIPFWMIINKKVSVGAKIKEALGILTLGIIKIPQGVMYNKNHTWAFLEKSGNAQVGVNDLLLHLTGSVTFNTLRLPGESISKGELMAEIRQNGKTLRVHSPISGQIISSNHFLSDEKGVRMNDTYNDGWLYRIVPLDWKAETASSFFGEEARQWFKNELERFKDFVARSVTRNMPETAMVVLQEGGEVVDNALEAMPGKVWENFQKEFLD